MNRLRLSFITGLLLTAAGCSSGNSTLTAPDEASAHDAVAADHLESGWTGTGHEATASDTTGRGGGWAGSGH